MNVLIFLISLYVLNFLLVISIIFKKNSNPYNTLAWLLFLLILPFIGLFIYLFVGRSVKFDVSIMRKNIEDKKIDTFFKSFFKNNNCNTFFNICENRNNIKLFFNGISKFESMLKDIEKADKFINIQYYIFKNDEIGNSVVEILNNKAKQGVKINLLLDYMGTLKTNKNLFKNLNENFCITYFKLNILSRFNIHNHRKICIIDGKIAYIGGFNVGDEYLGKSNKFKFWRDLHMKVEGDAVYDIHKSFIKDWNYANKYTLNQLKISTELFPKHEIKNLCTVNIFTSGIDTKSNIYFYFNYLISTAKKSIYIETPYFIPNETILDNLKIASLRGVDIKIIVPKIKDHAFVKYANTAFFNELINTSINLYHYEHGFLHSKLIIVDNKVCTIGSANMDYRSLKINFEISAVVYSDSIAKKVTKQFFEDLRSSTQYKVSNYKNRSKITIIKENIAKLLSPLL